MHLSLRAKVLLTTASLMGFILLAIDILWIKTVEPILHSRLQDAQQQIGFRASEKVEDYITAKIQALIIHSQSAAFLSQNKPLQRTELFTLLAQDQDIEKISVIDMTGHEELAITQQGEIPTQLLQDKSKSQSFLTTTFRYGKESISDVSFVDDKPTVVIAIPITIPEYRQRLTDLTTAGVGVIRSPGDILGVLEVTVNLSNLFGELTTLGSDQSGFVYIVDRNGQVVAHRNKDFLVNGADFSHFLPVQQYINSVQKEDSTHETANIVRYINEDKQDVYGTFVSIPKTLWAIIIQQPYDVAMADVVRISTFAVLLLIGGVCLGGPLSYFITRKFTDPIALLVNAANALGMGNFDYRVNINSRDELETLAHSFNTMASRIKNDREIISAERNKLATVISGISDAVIAIDIKRNIVLFNAIASDITGFSQAEVLGKPIDGVMQLFNQDIEVPTAIYSPVDLEEATGILWSQKNLLLKTARLTGEKFVNVVSGQIREGRSVGIGCILTIHDVSKERQLEEMKLDFVSMAAHELRTPLTAIRGYTEILKQKQWSSEDSEIIKRLGSSAENLSGLIDNLLNTSRIENGKMSMETTVVDMKQILRDVLEMLADQFEMKHLHVQTEGFDMAHSELIVDPMRIREVVTNLLTNAIRYTSPEGTVTIKLGTQIFEELPYLRVEISDTGHGIPQEAISHLFTKFYRVHGTLEMGSKGTGLGLFISKSIIDMHKGKIGVKSIVGQGSTFFFDLPMPSAMELEKAKVADRSHLQSKPHGVILNPNIYSV